MNSKLIAVIGDEDTVTGLLLAGVGQRDFNGANFLAVTKSTPLKTVEDAFKRFISRKDVAIVLVNQHIANDIRHLVNEYHGVSPTLLEIPSKEHPYDPSTDPTMAMVERLLGAE